jgi:inosine/xanthosine triphosphate pyrophosphatase family protein
MHPLAKTLDDLIQTITRALYQAPRRMKAKRPDYSDASASLIDLMLKKKPQLRPTDLGALISAMEAKSKDLRAQHGHVDGQILRGLERKLIDGNIYSRRYSEEKHQETLGELRETTEQG